MVSVQYEYQFIFFPAFRYLSEIYLDHRMEQSPLRQLGFRRYFQQPFQLESESGLGRSGLEHQIRMEFRLVRSLVRRLVRSLVSPLVRWLLSGMGLSTLASPTLGTSRWDYPHWGGGSGHYPNRPNRPHWATTPGFGGGVSGIRPNGNRPNSNNGLNRPNSTRPGTGSALRPGTSNSLRPGTGTTTRPGSSTGTINRPGTTRPILPVSTGRQVRHVRIRQLPVQERSPGRIQARIYAREPIRPVPHKGNTSGNPAVDNHPAVDNDESPDNDNAAINDD